MSEEESPLKDFIEFQNHCRAARARAAPDARNYPKQHPRCEMVNRAELHIGKAISIARQTGISETELGRILLKAALEANKYCLRFERHGDTDSPADLEKDE